MVAVNVSLSNPYTRPTTSDGRAGGLYIGEGVPTATLVAPKGSLYINQTASTSATRLYIATDAVGTWAAISAAS